MTSTLGDITLSTYLALAPEIYLAGATLLTLLYGVYRKAHTYAGITAIAFIALMLTGWLQCHGMQGKTTLMNGMLVQDYFSFVAKWIILIASAGSLLLSVHWLRSGKRAFEFIILQMLATLGMLFMVAANDFIVMYMALEMSSLSLYVLAAFSRDDARSSEAGLKYFVLGALASGMMLYGMSLVYGFAGTTHFDALSQLFAANGTAVSKGVIVGMVLMVVGLCFKVSAVPFHMWTPDVYEGSPTPVTTFFATAPKAAAIFLFSRVMLQAFGPLVAQWREVILFVAVASLLLGALAGMMQSNIKRLLAYSSIGHVGFMLIGLAAANVAGVQAIVVYVALYALTALGAFGCLQLVHKDGENPEEIKSFAGLAQTHPAVAMLLSVFMFSMAGIPPLAGFFGKMMVILAAVGAGYTGVAVVAVIASVISGFYYIKVVKVMYFDAPEQPLEATASRSVWAVVGVAGAVNLLFFLLPTPLLTLAQSAAEALLK